MSCSEILEQYLIRYLL